MRGKMLSSWSVGKAVRMDHNFLLKNSGELANGDIIPHLFSLKKEQLPEGNDHISNFNNPLPSGSLIKNEIMARWLLLPNLNSIYEKKMDLCDLGKRKTINLLGKKKILTKRIVGLDAQISSLFFFFFSQSIFAWMTLKMTQSWVGHHLSPEAVLLTVF